MTDRLSLYNRCLRQIGERTLANLTESVEARRALDSAWDGGFLRGVLEQGQWNFAIRTVKIDSDPDFDQSFGYQFSFDVPTDWVRTVGMSTDEFFVTPLDFNTVSMEGEHWYLDTDPLYVRYVSTDAAFGGDYSLWPETFTNFAALYLAQQMCSAATSSESKIDRINKAMKRALFDARAKDAMNEGTKFPPQGSWVSARQGRSSRRDRGNRNNLIG